MAELGEGDVLDGDDGTLDDAAPGLHLKAPDHPDRHAWRAQIGTAGPHTLAKDATYVFGLGAQKAGSTWLFDYLLKHPQCHMPARKELHYFSQPYHGDLESLENRFCSRLARRGQSFLEAEDDNKRFWTKKILDDVLWRSMFPVGADGHAGYFRYLSHGYSGEDCICDITPAYATVEQDMLSEMHRLVPRSRFVFFMRDPVDRLWSQSRMRGFNNKKRSAEKSAAASAKFFRNELESFNPERSSRNNYLLTLRFLDEAVPKENVHAAFYETFFAEQSIDALSEFLGIEPLEGAFGKRVNTSRGESDLPVELAAEGARVLAPVYEDAFERFGDAVPETWRKSYEAGR